MDVWYGRRICGYAKLVRVCEYNYLDFGTKSANRTHILSQPNNVPASFVIPIMATSTERFNIVKAGFNYRFNWWGGP